MLNDEVYDDRAVATVASIVRSTEDVEWKVQGSHAACNPSEPEYGYSWFTEPYSLSVDWVDREQVVISRSELRRNMRAAVVHRLDTEWWVWNGKKLRCQRTSATRGRCVASAWAGDSSFTARVRFRKIVHRKAYPTPERTEVVGRGRIRFDNSYCRAVGNPNCVDYFKVRW